ncbi:MAG: ShlB/FhaC/HecB family hemolysin secretion/activation protein, partial [Nitrospira sp.]|nr:ShlB/FhaC/HecB family hemolysin secretion/activation protein [Nitrospira sp.]MBH0183740.1 ShlB/FhaC/HecB family hemolysin secretion/activation protein [Nitrospira sp.]MBH0187102.1 ShlB/FhaC/HecB family hemolysin secretion/activation protein [Nitrospira sp.]
MRVMQRRLTWLMAIVPIACLVAHAASAQVFLPPISDPGGRSLDAPTLLEKPPMPAPITPAAPLPPTDTHDRLPPVKVFVREFRFEGQTVLTAQELHALAAPYTGREVTTEDLESVRTAVTLLYVQRGYVTSGAVIPDQAVTEGLVRIQIIEG